MVKYPHASGLKQKERQQYREFEKYRCFLPEVPLLVSNPAPMAGFVFISAPSTLLLP